MNKTFATAMFAAALAGCAHAPRVESVKEGEGIRSFRDPVVHYTLPKTRIDVLWKARQGLYVPGPLSAELDRLLAKRCDAKELLDRKHPCYWNLRPKRPSNPVASCPRKNNNALTSYLLTRGEIEVATTGIPDPTQQYAVSLRPAAFERLKASFDFTAQGGLARMEAQSTNLVAETSMKLAAVAAAGATGIRSLAEPTKGLPRPETPRGDFPGLVALAAQLDALESRKSTAATAVAVEQITAEQGRLRALAEGRLVEGEIERHLSQVPEPCYPRIGHTCQIEFRSTTLVSTQLECETPGLIPEPVVRITATAESTTLAHQAARSQDAPDPHGLRYRVPVSANLTLVGRRCGSEKDAFELTRNEPIQIAQWGEVLTLPRSMGWASGSLTAKLDPDTGALLTLASETGGSAGAAIINQLYAESQRDPELEGLKRRKESLELQTSICTSRNTLGLDPGPECESYEP